MANLSSHHHHHHLNQGAISASTTTRTRHVITLVKGEQRWRFHLERNHEREMIDYVAKLAEDPSHPLDWFDAAVVTHQITKQLEMSLTDSKGPNPNNDEISPGAA